MQKRPPLDHSQEHAAPLGREDIDDGVDHAADICNGDEVGIYVDATLRASTTDPGLDRDGDATDEWVPRDDRGKDVAEDENP